MGQSPGTVWSWSQCNWTTPLLPWKSGAYCTMPGVDVDKLTEDKTEFQTVSIYLRGVFSWCNIVLCIISILSLFIKINFLLIASMVLWDGSNYESFASTSDQWSFTVCVYISLMFIPQDYRQGDSHSRSIDYFVDVIEQFSIDCRKTKTKAITPTNHNRNKQGHEPITILSNYL